MTCSMQKVRNSTVDIGKIIAIFGVVFIHVSPNDPAAHVFTGTLELFCVPYFLLISLYFFIDEQERAPVTEIKSLKLDRLIFPYIFWTIFYLNIRLVRDWLDPASFNPEFKFDWVSSFFWSGGATQLYFIPLLIYIKAHIFLLRSLKQDFLSKKRLNISNIASLLVLYTYGIVGYLNSYITWGDPTDPFGWLRLVVISFLYPLLAWLLVKTRTSILSSKHLVLIGIFGFALLEAICYYITPPGNIFRGNVLSPLAGFFASLIALNFKVSIKNHTILYVIGSSYGVYLVHIAVWQLYKPLLKIVSSRLGVIHDYTIIDKLLISMLVLISSILLIKIVRISSKLKYIMLGEKSIEA
jgi:Acyltransferase family